MEDEKNTRTTKAKTAAKAPRPKKAAAASEEKVTKKAVKAGKPATAPAEKKAAKPKAAPAVKKAPARKPAPAVKQAAEKAGDKPVSEYYVIRTIQRLADNCNAALTDYNENLKKAMETATDFMGDMGKGTVEALSTFVVDGKNLVAKIPLMEAITQKVAESGDAGKTVAENLKKAISEPAKKAQFMVTTVVMKAAGDAQAVLKDYNEKYVKKGIEYGTDLMQDVGNVTLMTMSSLAETGKKFARNLAVLESIENAVESGLTSVSSKINLPSKKDIDRLVNAMKAFNRKIEAVAGKAE